MKKNYLHAAITHTIVTHKRPHIDELLAIVLLQMNGAGEKVFPGVKDAKIEFWNAGIQTPDGRPWTEWHKEGYLLIGVGGSCFDEHVTKSKERKEGCAASLIAEAIDVIDAPWLEKILHYVVVNDTKGGNHPYELGNLVALMNDNFFATNPHETIDWGMHILKAILKKQILFFNKTGEEYDNCSKVFEVLHKGKNIIVCQVASDDPQIAAYARSKHGANADVVIQKYPTGHTFVTTKKMSNISLDEVIKSLRIEERKINGKTGYMDHNALIREGNVEGAECWYYHKPASMILNGSRSNTDVPATKIPFEKVTESVKKALAKDFFTEK